MAVKDPLPSPQVEETKDVAADLLADTFAKFGLNMGALLSGQSEVDAEQSKSASCRVEALLEMIPDYGYLVDNKLYIDELFP